jgi:hypothetical protein
MALARSPSLVSSSRPFAVIVEASDGIDPLLDAANQFHHGGAMLRIAHRGDGVVRLVQRDVDLMLGRVDQTPVHFDVVAFQVGLRAQFGDHRAVHRYPAFHDILLRLPPRSHAGLREDLLKALFGHYVSWVSAGGAASASRPSRGVASGCGSRRRFRLRLGGLGRRRFYSPSFGRLPLAMARHRTAPSPPPEAHLRRFGLRRGLCVGRGSFRRELHGRSASVDSTLHLR